MITRFYNLGSSNHKGWSFITWIIALALLAPVLVMVSSGVFASTDTLSHLWQTVLPDYIQNSLQLGFQVVCLSLLFGVPSAVLVSKTNLIGAKYFRWLLLLPLAMPAYVIAYIYTDLFDYAGPMQRALRKAFEWQSAADYWFFDIRSLTGASIMIALVLFPYVFMLVRTTLELQDDKLIQAGRSLGKSPVQCLWQISLPLAIPAMAISSSLVLMETLADFATVQYFAVNTLTTAIYDTWLEYNELATANGIASILLLFVLFAVVIEQRARASKRVSSGRNSQTQFVISLSKSQQAFGFVYCSILAVCGFLLPAGILLDMTWRYWDSSLIESLTQAGVNSLEVAFYTASFATVFAISFVLYQRLTNVKGRIWPLRVTSFGYAIPGTVLAMAMLATFGPLDNWLNDIIESVNLPTPGLILSGTIFAIVFALIVRFGAIANGTISSGIEQIPHSLDNAPASLGIGKLRTIAKVHLPLLKKSIFVAWLLVFVEAMKELPAVLLLRPFNFDTLSTFIYQMIADEQLEQSAIGALLIVAFGLIPILVLNKEESKA